MVVPKDPTIGSGLGLTRMKEQSIAWTNID